MLVGANAPSLADKRRWPLDSREGPLDFREGTTSVVPLIDTIELGFSRWGDTRFARAIHFSGRGRLFVLRNLLPVVVANDLRHVRPRFVIGRHSAILFHAQW